MRFVVVNTVGNGRVAINPAHVRSVTREDDGLVVLLTHHAPAREGYSNIGLEYRVYGVTLDKFVEELNDALIV